jgi:lysophospholipase L1-like esterase
MPKPSRRWLALAAVPPLAVAGAFVVVQSAAAESGPTLSGEYVALGDSYTSGVGTREYDPGSGDCLRSPHAYPVIDAARIGATLTFVACSGAVVSDVVANQIGELDAATTWVTVQVGGNDAGFVDVITECALPEWASDCPGAVAGAQSIITNELPGRLDSLYNEISARSPSAVVAVVGYPRLFMGEDCNAGTWFSPEDQQLLNETADLLGSTINSVAGAHGFAYVDPIPAYIGHAVCDDVEWINGLSNPLQESYHPNRDGQVGYADLVDDYLG